MLRNSQGDRSFSENMMLASSTAFVSGVVNVAGMIGFLAFTSNVTGHVANLANHIVKQNFHEIIIFLVWLLMFFSGAFVSSFVIRSLEHKSYYTAHSIPVILEIILLLFVAVYGRHFYDETQPEREQIIAVLLFAIGLQNNLVSTVSGGLIKSSHLTGLFTDLGGEVAEWFHPKTGRPQKVKEKILIRLTILSFYVIGGIAGGFFFNLFDFAIFYFVPLVLLTILYYDLSPVALHKLGRIFGAGTRSNSFKQ